MIKIKENSLNDLMFVIKKYDAIYHIFQTFFNYEIFKRLLCEKALKTRKLRQSDQNNVLKTEFGFVKWYFIMRKGVM